MVSSTIKKLTIEKNLQTTTVTYKQQQLPTNNNSYLQTTTVTYKQQQLPTNNSLLLKNYLTQIWKTFLHYVSFCK